MKAPPGEFPPPKGPQRHQLSESMGVQFQICHVRISHSDGYIASDS